jgi:hypothetical protein
LSVYKTSGLLDLTAAGLCYVPTLVKKLQIKAPVDPNKLASKAVQPPLGFGNTVVLAGLLVHR